MNKRVAKKITDPSLKDYLLNIKESDVTSNFIYDLFGEYDGKCKCYPYDLLEVPPGFYGSEKKKNKNTFTTGVGVWIFNKWMIEKDLFDIFHYINRTIDSDVLDDINQELSYALMEDRISTEDLKRYLMKTQFAMQFVTVLSPNYSEELLTITEKINVKKAELIKKHQKEIDDGDAVVALQIEKELIDYGKDLLKDDPSLDVFISGARSNIGNHFKNMFVWKGVTINPDPDSKQQYTIATSTYMEGIKPEEYGLYANTSIDGSYSRAVLTSLGLSVAFAHVQSNLFEKKAIELLETRKACNATT